MTVSQFRQALLKQFKQFHRIVVSDNGDWVVKGFIDIYKNIYPVSSDTKVISKIIELMLLPALFNFADRHKLKIELGKHQNHYPDISFVARNGVKIALDVKSTYRANRERANGFTLGSFTGYFRQRNSAKNVTFPYGQYAAHLVLGVIYSRSKATTGAERRVFSLKISAMLFRLLRVLNFYCTRSGELQVRGQEAATQKTSARKPILRPYLQVKGRLPSMVKRFLMIIG